MGSAGPGLLDMGSMNESTRIKVMINRIAGIDTNKCFLNSWFLSWAKSALSDYFYSKLIQYFIHFESYKYKLIKW